MKKDFNSMIQFVENESKKLMKKCYPSHGWEHVERVRKVAMNIAKKEGANIQIVELAAILHDTGRFEEIQSKGKICHAKVSVENAKKILKSAGFSTDVIKKVCHSIATHRFRSNKKPVSLEAMVLFDADKLDSIGATGIARAYLFAGEVGAKLHNPELIPEKTREYGKEDSAWREFNVKLKFVKNAMLTKTGKKLALKRHSFMEKFFKVLNEEFSVKR